MDGVSKSLYVLGLIARNARVPLELLVKLVTFPEVAHFVIKGPGNKAIVEWAGVAGNTEVLDEAKRSGVINEGNVVRLFTVAMYPRLRVARIGRPWACTKEELEEPNENTVDWYLNNFTFNADQAERFVRSLGHMYQLTGTRMLFRLATELPLSREYRRAVETRFLDVALPALVLNLGGRASSRRGSDEGTAGLFIDKERFPLTYRFSLVFPRAVWNRRPTDESSAEVLELDLRRLGLLLDETGDAYRDPAGDFLSMRAKYRVRLALDSYLRYLAKNWNTGPV